VVASATSRPTKGYDLCLVSRGSRAASRTGPTNPGSKAGDEPWRIPASVANRLHVTRRELHRIDHVFPSRHWLFWIRGKKINRPTIPVTAWIPVISGLRRQFRPFGRASTSKTRSSGAADCNCDDLPPIRDHREECKFIDLGTKFGRIILKSKIDAFFGFPSRRPPQGSAENQFLGVTRQSGSACWNMIVWKDCLDFSRFDIDYRDRPSAPEIPSVHNAICFRSVTTLHYGFEWCCEARL